MILGTFDHAFVLNLDIDKDRYTLVDARLRAIGIVAERIPCKVPSEKGGFKSKGIRGCTESHEKAVKLAKERGYKNILIFEDDVIFRNNFLKLWEPLKARLSTLNYDLFYFYDWGRRDSRKRVIINKLFEWTKRQQNIDIISIDSTLCNHAYAVNSPFYDKMLDIFAENEMIGKVIDRLFDSTNARIYVPSYNLAGQDEGISRLTGERKAVRWSA
jgi:GR25 family glycosyltransferase involved in LPS biosynthesis